MTLVGIILFGFTVAIIVWKYGTAKRAYPFPMYGWIGAFGLLISEALMFAGVEPIATYFTALAWTWYILLADAAVYSLRGRSLLRTYPAEFTWIAIWSIPLWLIFEAYNLRLKNWIYVGVPENWFAQNLGYAWAFATIWPGIFETAALIRAITRGERTERPVPPRRDRLASKGPLWISAIAGAIMVALPPVLPSAIRPYLFGFVWLGFIFLFEPINRSIHADSLWGDFENGDRSRLKALLLAGTVCGIFWEFWNYWARARWVYVFPVFQQWKMF